MLKMYSSKVLRYFCYGFLIFILGKGIFHGLDYFRLSTFQRLFVLCAIGLAGLTEWTWNHSKIGKSRKVLSICSLVLVVGVLTMDYIGLNSLQMVCLFVYMLISVGAGVYIKRYASRQKSKVGDLHYLISISITLLGALTLYVGYKEMQTHKVLLHYLLYPSSGTLVVVGLWVLDKNKRNYVICNWSILLISIVMSIALRSEFLLLVVPPLMFIHFLFTVGHFDEGSLMKILICKEGKPPSEDELKQFVESDSDSKKREKKELPVNIQSFGGPELPTDNEGVKSFSVALILKNYPKLINEKITYEWYQDLLVIKIFKK